MNFRWLATYREPVEWFTLEHDFSGRATIAKNQNSYAKRQRAMEKKAKAEAKRERRQQRKLDGGLGDPVEADDEELLAADEDSTAAEETP